jgi:hypothetical protein
MDAAQDAISASSGVFQLSEIATARAALIDEQIS